MNTDDAHFEVTPSTMNEAEFVTRFGGVYEHSPWIARQTWLQGIDAQHNAVAALGAALADTVDRASREQQMGLIRAHPDLAGRAAARGELTAESSTEQSSAGIDQCTPDEFERFQRCNRNYKDKFDFPFVMAVKGSNRHAILSAFEERLQNDYETEFQRALHEIHKIARLRLLAIAHASTTV